MMQIKSRNKQSMKFYSLILIFIPFFGFNQTTNWKGTLTAVGNKLDIILNLTSDGTNWTSSWDIPAQKVSNLVSSLTQKTDSTIYIEIKQIHATYSAKYNTQLKQYEGNWNQSNMTFPLNLTQIFNYTKGEIVRKQTPKPPFPYQSEEVIFEGKNTGINYGATFTYPSKGTQFPAIILINGSGQLDRNESLFGHQPFAVLADYFTKQGYAVLRIDDRGIGKTTGEYDSCNTFDFAKDVLEEIQYLKTRKEINPSKIGLVGHSEGGLIAPIVAAQSTDIAFLILMAGPGQPIIDLMVEQNRAIMERNNKFPSAINAYIPVYRQLVTTSLQYTNPSIAYQKGDSIVNHWRKNTSETDVLDIAGIYNDSTAHEFVVQFMNMVQTKWFSTFLQLDATNFLSQVKCPVLAINGTKDVQVLATSNLKGIETTLKKNGNQQVQIVELKNLNHLFQSCKTGSPTEYAAIEETINSYALKTMGNWLKKLK